MKIVHIDRASAQAIWRVIENVSVGLPKDWEIIGCRVHGFKASLPEVVFSDNLRAWDIHLSSERHPIFGSSFYQQYTLCRQLSHLLRTEQPDIVHVHFAIPGILSRIIARSVMGQKTRLIATCHESFNSMNFALRWGSLITQYLVDKTVYVSQSVARSYGVMAEIFERDKTLSSGVVIYNGIDVEAFADARGDDKERVEGRVLCSGRLVEVKGFDSVLRALPKIAEKRSNVHLRIAGSGPDESRLRALAGKLGIESRVEFLGWLDRPMLLQELQYSQAVVIPSDGTQEGFGLVAAEAMAAGVPIVASDIPVFQEVLGDNGDCARLFRVRSEEALQKAILDVLSDTDAAYQRRNRALDRVREKFSAAHMAAQYLAVYRQVAMT